MSSSSRPKLLFIGRGAPWVGGAGYLVRESMLLDAATKVADVTAVMIDCDPEHVAAGESEAGCERVVAVPQPSRANPGRWRRAFDDLTCVTPRSLRYFDASALRKTLKDIDPTQFDAVMVYRIDTAFWAGLVCPAGISRLKKLGIQQLILDIDDPEHARHARRIEATGETPDKRDQQDLKKLREFEIWAAKAAELAMVCQEADAQRFDPPQPTVVPNAVHVPPECPAYKPDPDTLLFVGNLSGGMANANYHGLVWFIDKVWPKLRQAKPNAILRIGGKLDDKLRARFADIPGLDLLGFVDDMAATVRAAAINLAPIHFGTGTRIKVLDALAQGGAVVGTTLACEGLAVRNGIHVRLADDADRFAMACVDLLDHPDQAASLGRAGHALMLEHYSMAGQVELLVELLQKEMSRR
jgi:glycosyltransferase involved in cell wall biosynthesis